MSEGRSVNTLSSQFEEIRPSFFNSWALGYTYLISEHQTASDTLFYWSEAPRDILIGYFSFNYKWREPFRRKTARHVIKSYCLLLEILYFQPFLLENWQYLSVCSWKRSNQGIICLGKQRPQHSAPRRFSKLVHQQLLKYTSTVSLLWEINEVLMGLSSFVMVCNMGALGKCTK